jgi:hypothetical protein
MLVPEPENERTLRFTRVSSRRSTERKLDQPWTDRWCLVVPEGMDELALVHLGTSLDADLLGAPLQILL